MWNTWRSVLHRTYCSIKERHLDVALGKWLVLLNYWRWFTNDKIILYTEQNGQEIMAHHKIGGSHRRSIFSSEGHSDTESYITSLRPTTIACKDTYIVHEGIHEYTDTSETPVPNSSYKKWLHYELNQSEERNMKLKQHILKGEAIGVSDGSF